MAAVSLENDGVLRAKFVRLTMADIWSSIHAVGQKWGAAVPRSLDLSAHASSAHAAFGGRLAAPSLSASGPALRLGQYVYEKKAVAEANTATLSLQNER